MKNKLLRLIKLLLPHRNEIYQLRNIIHSVPGSIYWKDKNGVYLGVSAGALDSLRKLGFSWERDDVVGNTDYYLFDKEVADRFRQNDLEVMQRVRKAGGAQGYFVKYWLIFNELALGQKQSYFFKGGEVISHGKG